MTKKKTNKKSTKKTKKKDNKFVIKIKEIFNIIKEKYNFLIDKWNSFTERKYIKTIFKFLPRNIFVFIMFLLSIVTIVKFANKNFNNTIYAQRTSDTVYPPILVKEDTLHFPLKDVETKKDLGKVCFTFATYGKKHIHSEYKYSLLKNGEVIYDKIFNSRSITDGEEYCFDLSKADKDHLSDYEVVIEPMRSDSDNAITIFTNSELNEPRMSIRYKNDLFSISNLLIVVYIIIFLILNYIINTKTIGYEKMWLIFSSVYFLFIMIAIPPYQVPDEIIHQNTAEKLTEFYKYDNYYEMLLDQELTLYNQSCLTYSSSQYNDTVPSASLIKDCLKPKEKISFWSPVKFTGKKIGHIMPALGFSLFSKISSSPLIVFMGGRLFNLLFSILIIYLAIKIAPKFKELFFVVGTIPMFVQQAVSLSYDSPLNCMSLLAVATILKLIYSEESFKKNIKYYLLLFLASIFIFDIKWIYLPILALLLYKKTKGKISGISKWLLIALIAIAPYLLTYILSHYVYFFKYLFETSSSVSSISNRSYILENPRKLLPLAYNTITTNGLMYLRGIVGFFGWFTYRLNDAFIYFYLLLFIYIIRRNDIVKTKIINKIIFIIGILFSIAAIFASMYFDWSPYQSDIVDGVQGRYFLPLLIPFILLFVTSKKKKHVVDEKIIYLFSNIVLLQYVIEILIYLY